MTETLVERMAVLPLRDIVVFPNMVVPLFVGRDRSVKALDSIIKTDEKIFLVSQKSASDEDPTPNKIYSVGTIATVLQLLKLPDGTVKILVEGNQRAYINEYTQTDPFYTADVVRLNETGQEDNPKFLDALVRSLRSEFDRYVKLNRSIQTDSLLSIKQIEAPQKLVNTICGNLNVKVSDKQEILETNSLTEQVEKTIALLQSEIGVLQVERKIKTRVKRQMEKSQRDYYLNEQMKAIQRELGDGEDSRNDIQEYEDKLGYTKLSKEAREKVEAEIKKLRQMSSMSSEATVVRNYLDWIFAVPWSKRSRAKKDLEFAEQVLNEDHYGLEKVKERIIEYLAVQQRQSKIKGPILCLVGPPGVGKTSLGKSIAKATGREFIRIALGGVRDEAEIRGHRRTYIGSMPGKIIQSMKKVKTINPLILLDEIDKMGQDFRGDPASAMLEILDPEQNDKFSDHYMEVDYDLSHVMFLTTANTYNMPRPLLDRMEIIRLSGYTEEEKLEIAKRYLLPKQLENNGLKKSELSVPDETIIGMIQYYTRESGVRNLERELAKLCRKALTRILKDKSTTSVTIRVDDLEEYLGVKKFKYGLAEKEDQIGTTTGLAWTEVGGDLLSIEALRLPGKGRMKTTGKLGDVMKESIEAASSFVRSNAPAFGIKPPYFEKLDIHVHVPEGATPKDGPSAGIAMVTSIVSVLTQIPVRRDIAMTGEVTLRGNVLPIGGLKEKLLAALRGGIKTVLIPEDNKKDLREIPDNVKTGLEIIPVSCVKDVLEIALTRQPVPVEWSSHDHDAYIMSAEEDDEAVSRVN